MSKTLDKKKEFNIYDVGVTSVDTPDYGYGFKNQKINQKRSVRNTRLPYWKFTLTANQAISTGTGATTALSGYTLTTNTGLTKNMYSTGSLITLQLMGTYMITYSVRWASNSTGIRESSVAGVSGLRDNRPAYTLAGGYTVLSGSEVFNGSMGDVFVLNVLQNSGGNLNVLAGSTNITFTLLS